MALDRTATSRKISSPSSKLQWNPISRCGHCLYQGDGPVGRVLAIQALGPEFTSPVQKGVCLNPRAGEVKGQPATEPSKLASSRFSEINSVSVGKVQRDGEAREVDLSSPCTHV